jgi:hypothetical protein
MAGRQIAGNAAFNQLGKPASSRQQYGEDDGSDGASALRRAAAIHAAAYGAEAFHCAGVTMVMPMKMGRIA